MDFGRALRVRLFGLSLVVTIAIAASPGAGAAASTVIAAILPGPLTVAVSGPVTFTVPDQPEPQIRAIEITLTVSDLRSTRAGWRISLAAAELRCSCGRTLPASSLTIAEMAEPVTLAGQPRDPAGGPVAATAGDGLSLDTGRVVVVAHSGHGDGVYAQTLTIQLLVPAHTAPGSYATSVVLTATAPA